jgi:hypothetical protein
MPYSAASRSPCVPLPPPNGDPRQEHLQEFEDMPEFYRLEIHHFCTVYKDLDPGMGRPRYRLGGPGRRGGRDRGVPTAATRAGSFGFPFTEDHAAYRCLAAAATASPGSHRDSEPARGRALLEEGSVRVIRASPRVLRMISLLGLKRVFALA